MDEMSDEARRVTCEINNSYHSHCLLYTSLMMGENHELKNGFVAPLYPNNPKHPRQKYLLTVKGLAIDVYKRQVYPIVGPSHCLVPR